MLEESPEISGVEMYNWAREICDFGPRRPGLSGYERAKDFIAGKISRWGVEVWMDEIDIPMYFPREYSLEVLAPKKMEIDCFPLFWSSPTHPEGLETELVYAGRGSALEIKRVDLRGKVALVDRGKRIFADAFASRESSMINSYGNAINNGAAGVITFLENTPDNAYTYSCVVKDMDIVGRLHPLPGLAIGKEDGFRLKEMCGQGPVRVKLTLQAETDITKTYTIMALLPGRTEEIILVEGHWCSTFTGAIDNASGNAALLAIIKEFSRLPQARREKTMLFQSGSTHEYAGCNLASYYVMKKYPEYVARMVFAMGVDHVASNSWTVDNGKVIDDPVKDNKRFLAMSENWLLYPIVRRAYKKYGISPVSKLPGLTLCETGVYQNIGIPQVRLVGVPLGYHTPWDTMEHFTPEQLERYTDAHIEILNEIHKIPGQRLQSANIWRFPYVWICGGLASNPYEEGRGENLLRRVTNSKLGRRIFTDRYMYFP
jgi:hypothetical protein